MAEENETNAVIASGPRKRLRRVATLLCVPRTGHPLIMH